MSPRAAGLVMIPLGIALIYGSHVHVSEAVVRSRWLVSLMLPLRVAGVLFGVGMIVTGIGLFLGWLPI